MAESGESWFTRKFKKKERGPTAHSRTRNTQPPIPDQDEDSGCSAVNTELYERLCRPIDTMDKTDGNEILTVAHKFLRECGSYRNTSADFRNDYANGCENLFTALNALATLSQTMVSADKLTEMQMEAMRLAVNMLFLVREDIIRADEEAKARVRQTMDIDVAQLNREYDERVPRLVSAKRVLAECVYEHSKIWFAMDDQASPRCDKPEKLYEILKHEPIQGMSLYNLAYLIKQLSKNSLWFTAHHHIEIGYRMLATLNEQGALHAAALERKLDMDSIKIPFPSTAVAAVVNAVASMVNVELIVMEPDVNSVSFMRRHRTSSSAGGIGSDSNAGTTSSSAGVNPFHEGAVEILTERDRIRGENAEIVREAEERARHQTRIFVELPNGGVPHTIHGKPPAAHRRASSLVLDQPTNTQEMFSAFAGQPGLPPRHTGRRVRIASSRNSSTEDLSRRDSGDSSASSYEPYSNGTVERMVPLGETPLHTRTSRLLQRGSDASKSRDDLLLGLRSRNRL